MSEASVRSVPSRSEVVELSAVLDVDGAKTVSVGEPIASKIPETETTSIIIHSPIEAHSLDENIKFNPEALVEMAQKEDVVLEQLSAVSHTESAKQVGAIEVEVGYQVDEPCIGKDIIGSGSVFTETRKTVSSGFHHSSQQRTAEWRQTIAHEPAIQSSEMQLTLPGAESSVFHEPGSEGMLRTSFVQTTSVGTQHFTRQVRLIQKKTVIRRKVVIVNGKETVTEEVVEEPPTLTEFSTCGSTEIEPQVTEQIVETVMPVEVPQDAISFEITSRERSSRTFSSASYSVIQGRTEVIHTIEPQILQETDVDGSSVVIEDVTDHIAAEGDQKRANFPDEIDIGISDKTDNPSEQLEKIPPSAVTDVEGEIISYTTPQKEDVVGLLEKRNNLDEIPSKEDIVMSILQKSIKIKNCDDKITEETTTQPESSFSIHSTAVIVDVESVTSDGPEVTPAKPSRKKKNKTPVPVGETVAVEEPSSVEGSIELSVAVEERAVNRDETPSLKKTGKKEAKKFETEKNTATAQSSKVKVQEKKERKQKLRKQTACERDEAMTSEVFVTSEVVDVSPDTKQTSTEEYDVENIEQKDFRPQEPARSSPKPDVEIDVKAILKDDDKLGKGGKKTKPQKPTGKSLPKKPDIEITETKDQTTLRKSCKLKSKKLGHNKDDAVEGTQATDRISKLETTISDDYPISQQFIDSESSGVSAEIFLSASFDVSSDHTSPGASGKLASIDEEIVNKEESKNASHDNKGDHPIREVGKSKRAKSVEKTTELVKLSDKGIPDVIDLEVSDVEVSSSDASSRPKETDLQGVIESITDQIPSGYLAKIGQSPPSSHSNDSTSPVSSVEPPQAKLNDPPVGKSKAATSKKSKERGGKSDSTKRDEVHALLKKTAVDQEETVIEVSQTAIEDIPSQTPIEASADRKKTEKISKKKSEKSTEDKPPPKEKEGRLSTIAKEKTKPKSASALQSSPEKLVEEFSAESSSEQPSVVEIDVEIPTISLDERTSELIPDSKQTSEAIELDLETVQKDDPESSPMVKIDSEKPRHDSAAVKTTIDFRDDPNRTERPASVKKSQKKPTKPSKDDISSLVDCTSQSDQLSIMIQTQDMPSSLESPGTEREPSNPAPLPKENSKTKQRAKKAKQAIIASEANDTKRQPDTGKKESSLTVETSAALVPETATESSSSNEVVLSAGIETSAVLGKDNSKLLIRETPAKDRKAKGKTASQICIPNLKDESEQVVEINVSDLVDRPSSNLLSSKQSLNMSAANLGSGLIGTGIVDIHVHEEIICVQTPPTGMEETPNRQTAVIEDKGDGVDVEPATTNQESKKSQKKAKGKRESKTPDTDNAKDQAIVDQAKLQTGGDERSPDVAISVVLESGKPGSSSKRETSTTSICAQFIDVESTVPQSIAIPSVEENESVEQQLKEIAPKKDKTKKKTKKMAKEEKPVAESTIHITTEKPAHRKPSEGSTISDGQVQVLSSDVVVETLPYKEEETTVEMDIGEIKTSQRKDTKHPKHKQKQSKSSDAAKKDLKQVRAPKTRAPEDVSSEDLQAKEPRESPSKNANKRLTVGDVHPTVIVNVSDEEKPYADIDEQLTGPEGDMVRLQLTAELSSVGTPSDAEQLKASDQEVVSSDQGAVKQEKKIGAKPKGSKAGKKQAFSYGEDRALPSNSKIDTAAESQKVPTDGKRKKKFAGGLENVKVGEIDKPLIMSSDEPIKNDDPSKTVNELEKPSEATVSVELIGESLASGSILTSATSTSYIPDASREQNSNADKPKQVHEHPTSEEIVDSNDALEEILRATDSSLQAESIDIATATSDAYQGPTGNASNEFSTHVSPQALPPQEFVPSAPVEPMLDVDLRGKPSIKIADIGSSQSFSSMEIVMNIAETSTDGDAEQTVEDLQSKPIVGHKSETIPPLPSRKGKAKKLNKKPLELAQKPSDYNEPSERTQITSSDFDQTESCEQREAQQKMVDDHIYRTSIDSNEAPEVDSKASSKKLSQSSSNESTNSTQTSGSGAELMLTASFETSSSDSPGISDSVARGISDTVVKSGSEFGGSKSKVPYDASKVQKTLASRAADEVPAIKVEEAPHSSIAVPLRATEDMKKIDTITKGHTEVFVADPLTETFESSITHPQPGKSDPKPSKVSKKKHKSKVDLTLFEGEIAIDPSKGQTKSGVKPLATNSDSTVDSQHHHISMSSGDVVEITLTAALEEESSETSSEIPLPMSRAKQKRSKRPRPSIFDPNQWAAPLATVSSSSGAINVSPQSSNSALKPDLQPSVHIRDRSKSPSYADILANRQDSSVLPVIDVSLSTCSTQSPYNIKEGSKSPIPQVEREKQATSYEKEIKALTTPKTAQNVRRGRSPVRKPEPSPSRQFLSFETGSNIDIQQRRNRSKSPSYASVASGVAAGSGQFWYSEEDSNLMVPSMVSDGTAAPSSIELELEKPVVKKEKHVSIVPHAEEERMVRASAPTNEASHHTDMTGKPRFTTGIDKPEAPQRSETRAPKSNDPKKKADSKSPSQEKRSLPQDVAKDEANVQVAITGNTGSGRLDRPVSSEIPKESTSKSKKHKKKENHGVPLDRKKDAPDKEVDKVPILPDPVVKAPVEPVAAEVLKPKSKKTAGRLPASPEQLDFDFNISFSAKLSSDRHPQSSSTSSLETTPLTANIKGTAALTPDGSTLVNITNIPRTLSEETLATEESSVQEPFSETTSFIMAEVKDTLPTAEPFSEESLRQQSTDNGKELIQKQILEEQLIASIKDAVESPEQTSFRYFLSSPDLSGRHRDLERNIERLKALSDHDKNGEIRLVCITTITEYLETMVYIIHEVKSYVINGKTVPNHKLAQLKKLQEELEFLRKCIPKVGQTAQDPILAELEEQRSTVAKTLVDTTALVNDQDHEWNNFQNEIQRVYSSLNSLKDDAQSLEDERIYSFEERLERLDELEKANNDCKFKVRRFIEKGRKLSCPPFRVLPPSLVQCAQLTSSLEDFLISLRNQVEQTRMLSQEYRETLIELEHVTKIAQQIVDSRVTVNSLQHLQDEMQKGRKFFVSLSHCRSILESLEDHLDSETRMQHAALHKRLHSAASDILDRAGERIGVLALAASRWTIVEQGLADEAKWLQVAHQRAPCLTGVSTSDYEQYISLYQALSADLDLHSGRAWKLLDSAHSLQSVISCPTLEESCDSLKEQLTKLKVKVRDDETLLIAFQDVWTSFESMAHKIELWIKIVCQDKKLKKTPVDIIRFWELKAEYEYYKQLLSDSNTKFELSMTTLPVVDEIPQRDAMADMNSRWLEAEKVLLDAELDMYASLQPEPDASRPEKLILLEKRLEEIESAFTAMHGVITTDDQLHLHMGKVQVLLDSLQNIQEDLSRISLGPPAELKKMAKLQQNAKGLEDTLKFQLQGMSNILEKLGVLRKNINRAMRDQLRALGVLDQCQNSVDMDDPDVRQALVNSKGVCKALAEQWSELLSLRQDLHSIPLGIKASVNLSNYEKEISKLQESHAGLECRANSLVAELEARTGLWDDYNGKLDIVKGSVREAEYMMDMLKVQGPLDYNRLVKATSRLKGVQETFEEREPTLEELRESEQELERVVREEVGARLRCEVAEQEQAWKVTQSDLVQLVTSYTKAAHLWSSYATASQQISLQPGQSVQELDKTKGQLAELERLRSEISDEVGVEVLKHEVSALARRVEDAQQESDEIEKSPEPATPDPAIVLEDINKNLKKIEVSGGGDPTKQLNDLLGHLTALGRTQSNLSTVSESSTDNLQIVQLLQVWERIFRETFQEYHRLSSRLVQTEQRNAVLNLWQDYLKHINQLLSAHPRLHYDDLQEQNQLLKVHRDVLGCQKFLLSAQMASGNVPIVEKLSLLTNLHNETLSKIMEKQAEIQYRMKIWKDYKKNQADFLEWLKNMESERNKLNLRDVSLLKLKKTNSQIEELLMQLKEGDTKMSILEVKFNELIKSCSEDENLSRSLRIEYSSISHRLSNLNAALSTWKTHYSKLSENYELYLKQYTTIELGFAEIKNLLSSDSFKALDRIPFDGLQANIKKIQEVETLVGENAEKIQALLEAQEPLRDNINPSDMKNLSQKSWLLDQQQHDLTLQLSLARQAIQDRVQLSELFDRRFERFISWTRDANERLDRIVKMDASQALRRLETELHAEVSLHKREVEWLFMTGRELLSMECENSDRGQILSANLDVLDQAWKGVLANTDGHASKLRSIVQRMSQLELQMSDLRVGLQEIEGHLLAPIILEETSKTCADKLEVDHQELQGEIDEKSSSVGEVLNLFELLLHDCKACQISVDTDSISMAMSNLEKRWKNICLAFGERKTLISQLWPKVKKILQTVKERRKLLEQVNSQLDNVEKTLDPSSKTSIESVSETSMLCKAIEKDLRKMSGEGITIFEDLYRQLLHDYSIPNDLLILPDKLMDTEKSLAERAQNCSQLAHSRAGQYEKFVKYQSKALTALVKCDAMLTIAEIRDNSQQDLSTPEALAEYVAKIKSALLAETETLKEADHLGLEIMNWCLPRDVDKIQIMIDEYQKLWKDVNTRLARLKDGPIVHRNQTDVGVEVNTLKFETDQSTQVDTLGWSGPMLRKDAFIRELTKTCTDLESQITQLSKLERLDTYKKISKFIGQCESTYELARHLSDTLIEQCSANENEAQVERLDTLHSEFDCIRTKAQQKQSRLMETSAHGKILCPICASRNWHQLETDLWRLEQCVQFAEGTLASQPSTLPTVLDRLEIILQDQRELLQTLDSHQSILLSLNNVRAHLAEHGDLDTKTDDFINRLARVNDLWNSICGNAAASQTRLQTALIQNDEFHETINELSEWLERTEIDIRRSEPIDLSEPSDVIASKYHKFKYLKTELEKCEPRIVSLEEAARQVLNDDTEVSCKRLSRLRLRLHSLIRLTDHYLITLSAAFPSLADDEGSLERLEESSYRRDSEDGTGTLVRCNRFLGRVVRASVPISAFLLLLLGAATLLPQTQPDFACTGTFTFAPVVRFPNGLLPS